MHFAFVLKMEGSSASEGEDEIFLCILDFEATCFDANQKTLETQEIIEFPAVLLNASTNEVVDEFHSFCKPEINPKLTRFCTQLTGITQGAVDKAHVLSEVLKMFLKWIAKHGLEEDDFAIVTCGNWDLHTMLPSECKIKNIEIPSCFDAWINLKEVFMKCYNRKKDLPMVKMLEYLAMDLQGRHHSGRDDARNITRIVQKMISDGFIDKFEYTMYRK